MPAKTAAPIEIPYNLQGDKPPDLEAITKPIAEAVRKYLLEIGLGQLVVPGGTADDGKLVIVKDGAAAYQAMKGDATIAEDGTLAIGVKKIVTEMLAEAAVTTSRLANKSVTEAKLADAVVDQLYLEHFKVYPPTIISGENTRTENSYATLGTPDQVTSVFVPAGGVILVDYSAIVECNAENAARAAIFIGGNQLKVSGAQPAGETEAAVFGTASANNGFRLTSFPGGLVAGHGGGTYVGSDTTTGLAGAHLGWSLPVAVEVNGAIKTLGTPIASGFPWAGGFCTIRSLPEGTYTVGVRFKTSGGTLKAKERRLLCAVAGVGV